MRLIRLSWISAIVFAVLAFSYSADASSLLYTFSDGTIGFSFELNSKPTVLGSDPTVAFVIGGVTNSTEPSLSFVNFYVSSYGGGIAFEEISGDPLTDGALPLVYDGLPLVCDEYGGCDGLQLFSGSVTAPTLNTGIFDLSNFYDGSGATLTVAAVPEASTWAMMILGFLGLGLMMYFRREKLVASLRSC
jgi:hypothetical protein